jgi:CheY-like chemotaxis protein
MSVNDSGVAPKTSDATILFVDDYEDTRRAYAAEAERAGLIAELASDGEAALARVLFSPPSLVVAELMLAHVDGLELTRRIAGNPVSRAVPVILVTRIVLRNLAALAQSAGCAAVLTKPCPFDVLERTIRRVLRERTFYAREA